MVAVPLTFTLFVIISCLICRYLEKAFFSNLKGRNPSINHQQALHRFFSLCTFIAFNTFLIYGGRPEILRLPLQVQWLFNALIVVVSTLWLYRTWNRSFELYTQENLADKLRRQLQKLSIDWSGFFKGRSLEQLKPNEIYVLAKVLPGVTQQDRCSIYHGVLIESLEEEHFTPAEIRSSLAQLRHRLNLSDSAHERILNKAIALNPRLINVFDNQPDERQHLKHLSQGLIQMGGERFHSRKYGEREFPTQIADRKRFDARSQEDSSSPTIEIKDEN